jgi:hypothetical protein
VKKLTVAQMRYLGEIVRAESGSVTYNGRARKPVEALEREGLITYDYGQVPQAKGSGIEIVERFTCRPTRAGKRRAAELDLVPADLSSSILEGSIPARCPERDGEAQCIEPEGHGGAHDFRYDYDDEEDE